MIDGFYNIAFTGNAGSGFGMVIFRDGLVAGADVSGATYDGEYAANPATGKISIRVRATFPAGATPVQTGVSLAASMTTEMESFASIDDIVNQKTILFRSLLGPVNVACRKVRGFPANL